MLRRHVIPMLAGLVLARPAIATTAAGNTGRIEPMRLSDDEWKKRLTPAQYRVLRKEATEPAHSSTLNAERRPGRYHCAGCDLPLFSSGAKYDSGTGWPSFFEALPAAVQTKTDFFLIFPRTEYHCARCRGTMAMSSTTGHRRPESGTATMAWR